MDDPYIPRSSNFLKEAHMFRLFLVLLLTVSTAHADELAFEAHAVALEPPQDVYIEETPAIAFSPDGKHFYVFNRGQRALLAFDRKGRFIRKIGHGLFKTPHGLRIDEDGNLWTADTSNHLVIKFSPNGKVLMVLGKKGTGGKGWFDRDYAQIFLNKPSDVAFDADGNIYVADGGNFRIVKYSPTGDVLLTFGEEGAGAGQFNFPHSLVVDAEQRLLIADRENKRIQLFGLDGSYQEEWANIGYPYMLANAEGGGFWMTDARIDRLIKLSRDGEPLGGFGGPGKQRGRYGFLHGVTAIDGDVIVSDILNWKVERLVPKQRD